MIYRDFGATGVKVSQLGFGLMRLPILEEKKNEADSAKFIDEKESARMVDYAIDNGINYFDTAYVYHGGESENFTGRALSGGKRQKVHIATKSPVWKVKETSDFDRFLDEQLGKLQTDYIDFYLLHALNIESFERIKALGALDFLDKAKKSGKVRFAGFSFHDKSESYPKIFESYNWDFTQILYNYLDAEVDDGPGKPGFEYAQKKTQAMIIMEPLQGGNLSNFLHPKVIDIFKSVSPGWTPTEWALRWLWNYPEISILLSGMSTMEQVMENVRIASQANIGQMTSNQLKAVDEVVTIMKDLKGVSCRACGYCMPCPSGVDIPWVFGVYNKTFLFPDSPSPKRSYNFFGDPAKRADKCTECGQCEELCPHKIPIRAKLKEAHSVLKE